ncbi:MAG: NHL repeat-containing protein [Ilumatobacter sp.]|uniref:NHL repeat-containing protein n=1 Tax=Ilumatobacter sp. TaxID=1967498 RepID=UPI00262B80DF|nr:NHL repeat-containing protein [Ilumatobacter sp.]MDJ0771348.1 NHL repeat-containing protein [Ilumatobacter sp.]
MPDVSTSVRVSTGWSAPAPTGADHTGGARPAAWLGAPASGGLALPAADPSAAQLYAPRGVWLDDDHLIVADTGNHRVLIWHDPRPPSHADADVVLGQPDFTTEGAQAGGRGPEAGMRLPTGMLVHDGRLVIADAWNHRLLIWDEVPQRSDTAPDHVIGQPDAASVDENRGGPCGPLGFYWPFGIAVIDGRFWVADTGNRRVLAWDAIPEPGQAPSVVLGQPDARSRDENRGEVGPRSFRWPHGLAGDGGRLFVADAGNHRLLAWHAAPRGDVDADLVFGQPDFVEHGEFPYQPQSATALRFPYAIDIPHRDGDAEPSMVVADTANNRVLVWDSVPPASNTPADRVLGQADFTTNGENRWDAVLDDTFCWPYGVCAHRGRVAVADSGNNRVTVWEL